jgi:hypothetical protein
VPLGRVSRKGRPVKIRGQGRHTVTLLPKRTAHFVCAVGKAPTSVSLAGCPSSRTVLLCLSRASHDLSGLVEMVEGRGGVGVGQRQNVTVNP